MAVSEPVAQGFVQSLAHPGGNITGFTNLEPTFGGKWLELLFARGELVAIYGAEYALPDLLDHLAASGCSKIKNQWDRCGVYYVNPIERLER